MHNGLRSYSLIERCPKGPASSRVQGKHSHLPPRECHALERLTNQQQLGRMTMEPHTVPNDSLHPPLANDILRGADEIAEFIFGDKGSRRKVYYLCECTRLPVFRLGSVLCARRSVLLAWIAGQEGRVSGR